MFIVHFGGDDSVKNDEGHMGLGEGSLILFSSVFRRWKVDFRVDLLQRT